MNGFDPAAAPIEIIVAPLAVVVDVVLVADVEGGIGEDEIDAVGRQRIQPCDAVLVPNFVTVRLIFSRPGHRSAPSEEVTRARFLCLAGLYCKRTPSASKRAVVVRELH